MNTQQFTRGVFGLALSMMCAGPLPSQAQDNWPSRPVTIVFPGAAGATDAAVRLVARSLSERFGQPFIVEIRGGAGGATGLAQVAKATPDGYTIVFTATGPASLNKLLYKFVPYDFDNDFDPIVLLADTPQAILASPELPITTLQELIAFGRANPGRFTIGHPGAGTMGHLTALLLLSLTGIDGTPVSYRGSPPLVTDLLGGQISSGTPAYTKSVESVKVLALTSEQRVRFAPAHPTAREAGLDISASTWIGFVGPRGMPHAVVTSLNRAIDDFLKTDEGSRQFEQLGLRALGGSPERLSDAVRADREKWGPVIRAANISLD